MNEELMVRKDFFHFPLPTFHFPHHSFNFTIFN